MIKIYPLIVFLSISFLFTFNCAHAQLPDNQTSIIPNLSDSYLDRLINAAKANYPHVKANNHRVNVAKSNLEKAKISWLEPLTFSYVYQPNQGVISGNGTYNYFFNGIQLGAFVNIGTFFEKPSTVRAAKEELSIAANDRDEYLVNLVLDVKRRYYTYVERLTSLKGLTQSVLDASNAVQEIRHKYQKSEETFDNYNRAQISLSQQTELKLQAELNFLNAKAELEALVGDKLENIK